MKIPDTKLDIPPPCCTLAIDGSAERRYVRMLKAAGNPIRFSILKFLVTHPGCITGRIVDHVPISQATVSQHLKVLRDAGWVSGEIEGPATCYELRSDTVAWFRLTTGNIF
ncbi:MAG: ArsR family transcriptional regulator [Spirochaetales bacterium]|nr:MAG: ArsR family transcriptional regulator [Spirochaetales bacterium]